MVMANDKKELAVAALRNGTVIDHIPSAVLFKVVRILGLEHEHNALTIGCNLASPKFGTKGIIKVADVFYPEDILNRIALIAPSANINEIRNFDVVEKHPVRLPSEIVGLVRCNNPKCITNNEPMRTRFTVVDSGTPETPGATIRCHYCNRDIHASKIQLI